VNEWCENIYMDSYENAPTDGSARKGDAALRISRGGSWSTSARKCRSSYRGRGEPDYRGNDLGLRPAADIH